MNKENLTVLANIIGAVESGGQVYGKKDYACYVPPFANSNMEYTITLGWAQNFGEEAQKLITMIFDANPDSAKKIDKDGLIQNALKFDWFQNKWNPNEKEKRVLINLISSDSGKKCQDELFGELMQTFIAECESKYTTDVGAVMMYCEIRHLGGRGPAERIFNRLSDYSLDSVMASLAKDQNDTSNDNQVGDRKFWIRHLKCKEFIETYAVPEGKQAKVDVSRVPGLSVPTMKPEGSCTVDEILNIMKSWLGLSRAEGTHRPIIDLYNSYKPLARGYAVQYNDAYCATTVSAAFIKAGAVDLIGGTECGVEEFIKIFKRKGIWIEDGTIAPRVGDIICYNWDVFSQPNDGYADHIGIVSRVNFSDRTMVVVEGNMNGMVGSRLVDFGWGYIRGFARPDYWVPYDDPGVPDQIHAYEDPDNLNEEPVSAPEVTIEEAARNTIAGMYGVGSERKAKIEVLGLSYEAVQSLVNDILSGESAVTSKSVAEASSFSNSIAGRYKVTASLLNCRYKPGIMALDNVAFTIPNGAFVRSYGYYTRVGTDRWMLIEYDSRTGYVSDKYLSKQ